MKRIPYIAPGIPKDILATALDAVIVSDADGKIVEWNQHTTTTLSRPCPRHQPDQTSANAPHFGSLIGF